MLLLFIAMLVFVLCSLVALHFFARMRRLDAVTQSLAPVPAASRYRPMLRLLSKEDTDLISSNKVLARKLKRQRIEIFRGYLRALTRDYGRLLSGLRLAMVRSGVDRPDLAKALAKNQALFALALCRIEYRLLLHTAGFGTVDVSGLVGAMDSLRTVQFRMSMPNQLPAGAR